MTISNTMKKLLRFLIPLIATALLAALYLIFEVRILQLLSTWPKETEPQNILRVVFALASLLVLLLSYWVLVLKDKEKSLQSNLNSVENNFISNINELNHWKFHKKITLGVGVEGQLYSPPRGQFYSPLFLR
jgi:H+/Cl- antiporter ClcA